MAFIGESRTGISSSWCDYVCLDKEDCEVLSQIIGSLVARKLRTFGYYKGIHESGEATEKQVDKMIKAESELNAAESIEKEMREFLGRFKKSQSYKSEAL